ncbi:flagellar hook-length control protein FliK [Aminobacter anthyllidis]|uniref:Flagellar hook-length control protein FliK n=1 Tax=Aminobacter anthyllidis TaxID=1035067 RepID=A0A9X1D861_9HYPH|nr:flagellar hook-length control protein FliK [Aminobacter anthyllidis]MBT1158776.1 flagellar hook-length control protein FliK [Aminobacter anthyllidis]
MTDAISAALVSPLARHSSGHERNALANDDQPDFGQALASPHKGEPKSKGHAADHDAPRPKGLNKLAERLAARDALAEAEGDTLKTGEAALGETLDVSEPRQPDATAKEVKAEKTDEPALPLVLALSELRKAGTQPANAGSVDASDIEATDAAQPDAAGDVSETELATLVTGGKSGRSTATGSAPPAAAPVAAPATASAPEAQQASQPGVPETGATNDAAAGADKPARPTPVRQAEQPSVGNTVTVMSEQSIPAPAGNGANSTAGALALDIASSASRHVAAASSVQQLQNSVSSTPGAQVLKIQLRPVELGMVTANLHLAGEQLSVEIEVENAEAYNRLSSDREAINSALRGLGFDVDRVTILQPQSTNARADGGPSSGFASRDQASAQSGGTGGEGANSGNGRQSGRAANDDGNSRNISSSNADRPGSSRYI